MRECMRLSVEPNGRTLAATGSMPAQLMKASGTYKNKISISSISSLEGGNTPPTKNTPKNLNSHYARTSMRLDIARHGHSILAATHIRGLHYITHPSVRGSLLQHRLICSLREQSTCYKPNGKNPCLGLASAQYTTSGLLHTRHQFHNSPASS